VAGPRYRQSRNLIANDDDLVKRLAALEGLPRPGDDAVDAILGM
jgi:hypothetical protein